MVSERRADKNSHATSRVPRPVVAPPLLRKGPGLSARGLKGGAMSERVRRQVMS